MVYLRDIRQNMADLIKGHNPLLNVYQDFPGTIQVPAVVIMPQPQAGNFFERGMSKYGITWTFEVYCLVQYTDSPAAQEQLDGLIDPANELSVTRVLRESRDLNKTVKYMHVTGIKDYGGRFQDSAVRHIGAVITVDVSTC